MSRGKLAIAVGFAVAMLGMSTAAYATFSGGGPSPDPFVVGGGQFFWIGGPLNNQRDFSLDSHVEKKGLKTYGILRYGRNTASAESALLGDVRCVNIVGNEAVVGGTIRDSSPPQGWVMFLRDNGPPGGAMDQVSVLFIETLDFAGWPTGFPNTCPAPTEIGAYASYFNLEGGDIVVSGGSS